MTRERIRSGNGSVPDLAYARRAGSREQGAGSERREVGTACMVSTGRGNDACDALAPLAGVIA